MPAARVLVLGGSGTVGSAVVRTLAARKVPVTFTFHRGEERAGALAAETDARAHRVDLRDESAVRALFDGLEVSALVHAAAIAARDAGGDAGAGDARDDARLWNDAFAVNVRSAFVATHAAAAAGAKNVVLLGALDRTQSLPLPATFAATQGALSAMTMALGKELGPSGVRVNMIALGPLDAGLSREIAPKLLEDFKTFSAMRRLGTAAEVATAVAWFALENTYVSGKVIAVNGGVG